MTALDKKLLRDLWHLRGQAAAICLVMACGVGTFVMSLSTLDSLQWTQTTYYDRFRFADVFAHLKRAPNQLKDRLAEVPGVAQVQTRVVMSVTLDVPGMAEPATGKLVSIPDRPAVGLNDLHLRSGRYVEPGGKAEVLVHEAFAQAHGLKPGDSVEAIINGRWQKLKIVGVALSPEYVYPIREGEFLPDNKRFGVFWMGYTELAAAFDMQGAFNDLSLSLMRSASEVDVLQRVDQLLDPYGGLGAYGRTDQTSNKFIANEMVQLRGMALVTPAIFLAVAAFLLNVVFARLIGTQRDQIATLKAFGYTGLEIGWHYLKMVLVLVLLGVGLGAALGAWLGQSLTQIYTQFFRFPVFQYRLDSAVVLLALGVCGGSALFGTYFAIRRAASLPPAEAMRPEAPARFRPTWLERAGLGWLLSPPARMIVRQLERTRIKSALACLGIALSMGVLILGSFVEDAVDHVVQFQFFTSNRQDLTISFVEPISSDVMHDIRHLPGVIYAEPFRAVPVRLRFGHHTRRLGLTGLPPDSKLFRLMDTNQRPVVLPAAGLVLTAKLAEVLACKVGDTITVEALEGERPVRQIMVAGIITNFTDAAAYMDINALHRLMQEGEVCSGAFLTADGNEVEKLYLQLKRTPSVAGVSIKQAMLRTFHETLAENLLLMRTFNVLFASVIAFGVIYNSARISLSERGRELATLRVIGFTRTEISVLLLGELAVLTLAALPLGLVFGYGLSWFVTASLDTETQRFPLVIYPSTYAYAALVTLAAAFVSGMVVRRRLDRLDLVAVLKARE